MIPAKIEGARLSGNLGGQVTDMKLDLTKMGHFMNILTDLYEDGELAVIREYSTNAADSHAMAGIDDPITVKLPSPLRQTFEVHDHGLGMSLEDIQETYGTYGTSTKTSVASVNGCLGLGSKSALTYTNMFIVRAVKDGLLNQATIYRDDRGAGSIEVQNPENQKVDEPNGVQVIVPTSAKSSFTEKALNFYRVWEKDSVKIIDYEVEHIADSKDAFWLNHKTLIVPTPQIHTNSPYSRMIENPEAGKIYVVLAGVPYEYDQKLGDLRRNRRYATYYFAEADFGKDHPYVPECDDIECVHAAEVDFVPNREALNLNAKTRGVVDRIVAQTDTSPIKSYVTNKINAAKSLRDGVEVWQEWKNLRTDFGKFHYKDIELLTQVAYESKYFDPRTDVRTEMTNKGFNLSVSEAHKSLFIKDKPDDKPFTYKAKEQVRQYMRDLGIFADENAYAFFNPRPDHPLFADVYEVDWATLQALKVEIKYGERKPAKPVEYKWTFKGNHTYNARPLPDDDVKQFVYIVNSHIGNHRIKEWSSLHEDTCFVYMTERRVDKFIKENPGALSLKDWQSKSSSDLPELTPIQREWQALSSNSKKVLDWAIEHKINDPKIKELASVDGQKVAEIAKKWYTYGRDASSGEDYIAKSFPLANVYHKEHTIAYLKGLKNL